jgi:ribosomal protein L9
MLGFIYNMLQADKNNANADKMNVKAFEKLAAAEEKKNQQERETRMSLEKLANRKRAILLTSMKDFIQTYEKIMKIDFQEGDGLKELSWTSLPLDLLQEMRSMASVAGMQMTDSQAIATFIVGGISGFIKKESEFNVTAASMRRKQANVVESQVETICIALDAIKQRADTIAQLLAKLNFLFRKSIEITEKKIAERGNNRNQYSKQDKEYMMTCINFATTLKKILDTKLLDEDGEITVQSIEAIRIGEEYLNRMKMKG